ncbi:MAG TPA: polyprenyl diphosphate synthase [Sandaracinaceae bacterium LLY-WYZ-13_1]|nr:polyprenyl diphosphate synthase [Sandaracinaceae bacterium LLY-WYZ-13_1]
MALVDVSRLPRHVAIIMDGNGRWAQSQGLRRTLGHREGSEAVRRTVRACRRLGIDALTLYAFSEQNWGRPRFEVDALMELLREFLLSEREELLERGIRLRSVGRRERLPERVGRVLDAVATETAELDEMTLTLALSYGGKEEIADAAREIARRAAAGELDPEHVDERFFGNVLPSMEVGPVDLLIRTSGELRLSNFLLWATAYSELVFSETMWPDFGEADLYEALAEYQGRDRRFGRVACAATEGALADPASLVASGVHV